jgi:hypothetical protein
MNIDVFELSQRAQSCRTSIRVPQAAQQSSEEVMRDVAKRLPTMKGFVMAQAIVNEVIQNVASVTLGPPTIYLAIRPANGGEILSAVYEGKEGESVQELMIRAANDVTDGEILHLHFSQQRIVNTEEQEDLAQQAVSVL